MKDYTFSEMLEICREYDDCAGCPFETICQNGIASVNERDIEPRDMIELPCKMEYEGKYGKCWKVYYRNVLDGTIDNQGFYDKTQAAKFLQGLKNAKSN